MAKSSLPWRAVMPLALVLLLAVAWSGYWMFASRLAQQRYALFVAKRAHAGTEIDCMDQSWGGFPFRILSSCSALLVKRITAGGTVQVTTGPARAVALAYKPMHLIAEFDGPHQITVMFKTDPTRLHRIVTGSSALRMSVKIKQRRPDQISLEMRDLTARYMEEASTQETARLYLDAHYVNVHIRFAEPPDNGRAKLDLFATMDQTTIKSAALNWIDEEVEVAQTQLNAQLTQVPIPLTGTFAVLSRRWQTGGGNLRVHAFHLVSEYLTATATGTLGLDERGRLSGRLNSKLGKLDQFLRKLTMAGLISEREGAAVAQMLALLSKSTGGSDKGEIMVPFIFKKGSAYFGPFKFARVPPL